MQHRQNRLPLLMHFQDQRHQLTAGGFVDAGKRFVEHHQRRALHHHPREEHALKLAAGERLNRRFRHR